MYQIQGDTCYACPTNHKGNSIQASIFKKHILATHPSVHSNVNPLEHTIIIEADISSSGAKTAHRKIKENLRHRIITTCGDANVMAGTKYIDPALCIYVGAHLICIDNKHLNGKVPRGNGTIWRVIGIKLKEEPQSYKWKNYYGRKVGTVSASDVEWVQCEHINKTRTMIQLQAQIDQLRSTLDSLPKTNETVTDPKLQSYLESLTNTLSTEMNNHKFKLEPESFSTKVSLKEYDTSITTNYQCKMKQIPANINNAITGHKIQGMSKDVIIVASWPTKSMFRNWEYVVLSCVRTLSGLNLVKPIDINKSFEPSDELIRYIKHAKEKETILLTTRKDAMSKIKWM